MLNKSTTYILCEVATKRSKHPRHAQNLIEQGQSFKTMRQSLSLSRPATVKLLHITLRTLHNWETGKVRIPYSAYKLIRLFSSYEIFHPIWKDWRIVGSRLVTPEGHSLEASNFHWLSLMARRAEAFTKVNQQLRELRELTASVSIGKIAGKGAVLAPRLLAVRDEISPSESAFALGLVSISTSDTENSHNQLNQGFQPSFSDPSKAEPKTTPKLRARVFPRKRLFAQLPGQIPKPVNSSQTQQVTVRGGLC